MSVLGGNPLLITPEGYQISRSVRLRSSASAYLNRTFPSAGNKNKWTYSGWFKIGIGTNFRFIGSNTTVFGVASALGELYLDGSNRLTFFQYTGGTTYSNVISTQVFRDPSAWYHIVCIYDDAQATASNRVRMFVNGSEITSFATASYPSQNFTGFINEPKPHVIGAYAASGGFYGDGYLTEVNFIDGQALTPSSFGETDAVTGVWKPKKYAGTYGTNGFYLNFSDNSAATAAAIGKDSSGNGNNWTPNNISVTAGVTYDSMLDVPTMWADGGNGRGNYCTMNRLDSTLTDGTITNGNLTLTGTSNWNACRATFGVSSGQWYWETVHSVYNQSICGIADSAWPTSTNYLGFSSTGYSAAYGQNALKYVDGSNSAYGATFTTGDVIGYALDMDAGTLTCYKNGVSQGTMVTGLTAYGTIFPAIAAANGAVINANFGQRPFAYTPPTGFKALNTQNLPDSTIKKGNQYFDATLYTGNSSTQTIVNAGGFQPDLVWAKDRTNAYSGAIFDSVRGAGNGKELLPNLTSAEGANSGTSNLTSFNSNGFSLGTTSSTNAINYTGDATVAWQWKESATAGFDIVTYTGTGAAQTVAHSLGVAPRMIIAKRRNGAQNWFVGHGSFASWSSAIEGLNTTAAVNNAATAVWNATAPTSSVFSVGTDLSASGGTYVAYLFAEVAGFSKFGSYTGNGSADGPFVFTGFKPRWIMWKRTDAAGASWNIYDTSRSAYNASTADLFANLSNAESTQAIIDILSNGWKIRDAGGAEINASGGTYIFAAFAENPFKNSLAR